MILPVKTLLSSPIFNNILLVTRRCQTTISKPIFTYMSLQARKDQVAISDKFGSITYGELDIKSNKVAKILHDELGEFSSRQQHSVSFLCGNDSTYSNTLFGIWKSGNIAVPLSISHPSSSLEYYIQDSESVAIITTKHFVDKIHHFADKRNVKLFLLEDMFLQGENHGNMENIINEENVLDQDALILYTSGTTGSPKGVVHTHNSLISQVNGMTVSWEWSKNDNILHILPLHHVHGLVNCLLTPLAIGAKVKMLPKFDAGDTWKIFLNAGKDNLGVVNVFMAVPTVYAKLIEYYQINQSSFSNIDVKKVLMKNMRLMVCGSAALPNKIINEWHSITGHRLLEQYGMTEIGRALGNPYHQVSRIPGFVGKPFPGVEVRIVETGTNNVLVIGNHNGTIVNQQGNQNLTGDLQIKGPNVFKNYFNKAEATRKEFTVDGWFKTGDVAEYVALSDTYRIVGRSSVDIIKSGGYKIGALEVERILLEHPSIKEVAVVGVDDDTWGQRVGAVIVLKENTIKSLELVSLKEWAKEKMLDYMIPTLLTVMDELPRNVMGKINKKELVKVAFISQQL